jgi:hypothetical protein
MMIHLRGSVVPVSPPKRIFPAAHSISIHCAQSHPTLQRLACISTSRASLRRYEKVRDEWQEKKEYKARKEGQELFQELE